MNNGNAWDFSSEFSGYEAACLINGIDPYPINGQDEKVKPIIHSMKNAYYGGVRSLTNDVLQSRSPTAIVRNRYIGGMINPLLDRKPVKNHLWSIEIEGLTDRYNSLYESSGLSESLEISSGTAQQLSEEELTLRHKAYDDKFDGDLLKTQRIVAKEFKNWASNETHEFDSQKFSRKELGRWIVENNFSSQYDFIKPVQQVTSTKSTSAETNEKNSLLLLIGVLCYSLQIKFDHTATSKIKNIIDQRGLKMSNDTIREKIRQAAAVIEQKQPDSPLDTLSKLNKLISSLD